MRESFCIFAPLFSTRVVMEFPVVAHSLPGLARKSWGNPGLRPACMLRPAYSGKNSFRKTTRWRLTEFVFLLMFFIREIEQSTFRIFLLRSCSCLCRKVANC